MNQEARDNERTDIEASERGELDALSERLMEEINFLRLEGALFCFDPREARRRSGSHSIELPLGELGRQPVTVKVDPEYGQPSVLAYKVLQAVFLKLAEHGCQLTEDGRCLYSGKVSFTIRELARTCERTWSGRTSKQLGHAIMQLHTTRVQCSLYDKDTEEWAAATSYVIPRALFSGKGSELKACVIELDSSIVKSINKRHLAFFNLQRLNTLDTIGVVLYKRIFFHLSNLNQKNTRKDKLKFEKDYEDICREWLGGLKPEKYKSLIISIDIRQDLAARDPGNAEWQRDLSVSHTKVGDVLAAQGDSAAALAAYRAGLAIRQTLAARDPGNAEWQRDLSVSHNKIGGLLLEQGDRDGALGEFRQDLAIAERLAAMDRSNAGWQTDVVASYWTIAGILADDLATRDEAADLLAKGIEILEALHASSRLLPTQVGWIDTLKTRRAELLTTAAGN